MWFQKWKKGGEEKGRMGQREEGGREECQCAGIISNLLNTNYKCLKKKPFSVFEKQSDRARHTHVETQRSSIYGDITFYSKTMCSC